MSVLVSLGFVLKGRRFAVDMKSLASLRCSVLGCSPANLLTCEPDKVAARKPARKHEAAVEPAPVRPRLGRNRTPPPA
jgi:hypothetical protein